MRIQDNTLPLPPPNGATTAAFLCWEDEVISQLKKDSHPCPFVRLWEAKSGLCITNKETRFPSFEKSKELCKKKGFDIAIRRSGGTAVPHGPGILNVSAFVENRGPRNIRHSYEKFCQSLQMSLTELGVHSDIGTAQNSFCDGDYNILVEGKKVIGTSQRWIKSSMTDNWIVLNHAVILLDVSTKDITDTVNFFYSEARSDVVLTPLNIISLSDILAGNPCISKSKVSNIIQQNIERSYEHDAKLKT